MTAVDVEVQVAPSPSIDVDVQFGDGPSIDVEVQLDPPTFSVISVLPTGPRGPAGPQGADGVIGADGAPGVVQSIVAGSNVTVDDTDPANPIVASTGGAGDVSTAVILAPDSSVRNQIAPDGDFTALEIVADAAQTETPFIITSDTPVGTTDLLQIRQGVAAGGNDIFTVDDSGEIDLHVVDPDAAGLTIDDSGSPTPGTQRLLEIDGSMENRNEIAAFLASDIGGNVGVNTQTLFNDGLRFLLEGFGVVADLDPVAGTTTLSAHPGQTDPLLVLKDENGDTLARLMPNGDLLTFPGGGSDSSNIAIGDPSTDPVFASLDIQPEQAGLGLFAANAGFTRSTEIFADAKFSNDAVWHTVISSQPNVVLAGYGVPQWSFRIDPTKTQFLVQAVVGQTAPAILFRDENSDPAFSVLPSGAIGTSAGEPADGDINPGECFQYFDPTNGAARLCHKGKTLDGTVVFGYGPMGP